MIDAMTSITTAITVTVKSNNSLYKMNPGSVSDVLTMKDQKLEELGKKNLKEKKNWLTLMQQLTVRLM